MKSNKFLTGILLCLIAGFSWGGQFPVMGSALKIMDPFYFTLLRYVSISIVLILLLIAIEGKRMLSTEGQMRKLWYLGTMGFAVFNFLVFLGQKLAGPSGVVIAAVMMAVQPLLGVIVDWIAKKGTPKPFTVLFMLTSLLGVVMVITKGDLSVLLTKDGNMFANFLILVGSLGFVIYTSGVSSFPGWSSLRYTTVTSIYGTVSMIIVVGLATIFGWLKVPTISMISDVSGPLLYTIVIAGVLAIIVWNGGNKIITPINGILFMNIVPVTTLIISVIQGYHFTTIEIIGALITIASLIGNNLYIRRKSYQLLEQPNIKAV